MTYLAQPAGTSDTTGRPAIECDATRSAISGWATLWSYVGTAAGIASLPLVVVCIELGGPEYSQTTRQLASLGTTFSILMFTIGGIIGATMLWTGRRLRKSLRRYAWTEWQIGYLNLGSGYVELRDSSGSPVSQLVLSTFRRGTIANYETQTCWFAGDPMKYGAISRPGGGTPRYAYRSPISKSDLEKAGLPAEQAANGLWKLPTGHRPKRSTTENKPRTSTTEHKRHGGIDDPDFPSPRRLRRTLAYLLDIAIHIATGFVITGVRSGALSAEVSPPDWSLTTVNPFEVFLWFLVASFIDRVILQAIWHTTIGKAPFGLVVIDRETGRYPRLSRLIGGWFAMSYILLEFVDNPSFYLLPAVRRRDLRERHNSPSTPDTSTVEANPGRTAIP
ncbi:RDD family protein [Nocardia sp. NPDC004654]|uniref:RDD family protein n=1 Tax=Nocardia sp. NPDC004654 TaxID=3154776 RepID=UPI0033B59BCE